MKSEDKICTPEQGKMLLNLNVIISPSFYWYRDYNESDFKLVSRKYAKEYELFVEHSFTCSLYPAPDVAEFLTILDRTDPIRHWSIRREHNRNWGLYNDRENNRDPANIFPEPEANPGEVYCAHLIWLISNKLLQPEDIKL